MAMSIKVLIADDHPLVRDGIQGNLESEQDINCIGDAGGGNALLERLREELPNVLILDLAMPDVSNPVEFIKCLRADYPTMQILVLTAYDDLELVRRVIGAGARGYLLKAAVSETLVDAIRQVAAGALWLAPEVADAVVFDDSSMTALASLTKQELSVLRLIGEAHTPKQIADILHITPGTVKTHLKGIYLKLDIHSRTEAILFAHKFLQSPQANSLPGW